LNAAESLLEANNNRTASQDICPLAIQRFITVFQESASKRCLTQMNPILHPPPPPPHRIYLRFFSKPRSLKIHNICGIKLYSRTQLLIY